MAEGDRRRGNGRRTTPAGIERAQRRPGVAPPRAAKRRREPPAQPDIPSSVRIDLPGDVRGDLRRHARHDEDVARALTIASDALESGDVERALEYLEWAKADAPRAATIREALGIARYLAGDWEGALSELQAYRRMSGRSDQNHLVADCLRAVGRPLAMVAEVVGEMDADDDGIDRVAEATIVWASALADAGDVAAGRAVLGRLLDAGLDRPAEVEEHHLRVWYVAGDLAERDGDRDVAEQWFGRVDEVDPDLYDVGERLERLRG